VVRAEACADDPYAALDAAYAKLAERLRRMRDRKRVHRGRHAPEGLSEVAARRQLPADSAPAGVPAGTNGSSPDPEWDGGESPVVIREKVHIAVPMTLDQALYEMELVGHDFYLFVDKDEGVPSVVYRRRGWSYGVIRLDRRASTDTAVPAAGGMTAEVGRARA